jgi:hypothetical protein
MRKLSNYRLAAVAAALGLAASAAIAEQTIGVQDGTIATDAVATARVNVRVLVPKIVILRVGDAANTVPQIDFTYGVAGFAAPQASASYTGAIPPALTSTTTGATGATNAGVVVVGAWTNMAGTTLTCALGALAGTSAFVGGATATGSPGTAGITWAVGGGANQLPHPGTNNNLTDCNGTNSNALAARTAYTGTYTYASNLVGADLNPGTYGLTITYTATAP